jgi:hypothetical protein
VRIVAALIATLAALCRLAILITALLRLLLALRLPFGLAVVKFNLLRPRCVFVVMQGLKHVSLKLVDEGGVLATEAGKVKLGECGDELTSELLIGRPLILGRWN